MTAEAERGAEIRDNLLRCDDSLAASEELLDNGRCDIAASRAYYAAFYAAKALLLSAGIDRGKHSGVIAAIHERFVKTGRLSPECGAAIRRLFRLRGIGDYGAPEHVSQQEARDALNLAHEFVAEVKPLVKEDRT